METGMETGNSLCSLTNVPLLQIEAHATPSPRAGPEVRGGDGELSPALSQLPHLKARSTNNAPTTNHLHAPHPRAGPGVCDGDGHPGQEVAQRAGQASRLISLIT